MATRLGSSVVLAVGLSLTGPAAPARAQAAAGEVDEVKNQFGLARLRLRNLAAFVRARLDEVDEAAARVDENRRRVSDRKIAVAKAESDFQQAKLNVALAEAAVVQYEQGTLKHELETAEGNIAVAKAELKRAEDRLEGDTARIEGAKSLIDKIATMPRSSVMDVWGEHAIRQNAESVQYQRISDKFGVDAAKFKVEQAMTARLVLREYTKEIRIRELRAAVEKAKSEMLAKRAEMELERDKLAKLENPLRLDRSDHDPAPTSLEWSALDKFGALEPAWKAIIARREDIEAADPAKRAEMKRLLDDFAKALDAADRAWSSAREAQLDDRDAATMHLFYRPKR